MKKKLKLWLAGILFGGFATFGIAACGVMPTPVSIDTPDETQQDEMINTLFETKYLDADLDVTVKYLRDKEEKTVDTYHLYGDMLIDIANLDNIAADASLHLDMNDPQKTDDKHRLPIIDLALTYVDDFAYVTINERHLKMKTDDFGEVMEIIMGEDNGDSSSESSSSSINNLSNTGIAEIINNLANMSYEDKGEYYEYVAKTTSDQPDLIVKTDTKFKVKNIAIKGIQYNDFTIDVNMDTNVLDELENPISSPENPNRQFMDVSTYFGAFKKLRKVLDDSQFSLNYFLELRHYDPATPNDKIYYGYTDGDISMDLDKTIVDIRGKEIVINDPETEGHDDYTTSYQAQYFDENIYLNYKLSGGGEYKLSYSNEGLADMFDMLGDESILGINFWDLIFGTGEKEYPIIDIISDSTYQNITEYTAVNFTTEYIELDVDCYLLGGKGHGYIRIYVDDYEEGSLEKLGITKVTIKDLDINSYIVDGELSFKDYVAINRVNTVDYYPLDNLDKVIRSGAKYFRSNKYALGLDVVVKNSVGEKMTVKGDAKLRLKDDEGNAVLEGGANVKVVDFGNRLHTLLAESKKENTKDMLYVGYTYQGNADDSKTAIPTFKAKASYTSIINVYQDIMAAMTNNGNWYCATCDTYWEEEYVGEEHKCPTCHNAVVEVTDEQKTNEGIMSTIAPFIAGATKDTVAKVLAGDYFAILRDETIKDITIINGNYKITVDAVAMLGFDCDLVLRINMNKEQLDSIGIYLGYNGYTVDATITLKDYDTAGSYIAESDLVNYGEVSHISKITKYIADNSHNGTFKLLNQIMSTYNETRQQREIGLSLDGALYKNGKEALSITDGRLDAALADAQYENEDMLSRLSLVLSGTFNRTVDEKDELGNLTPVNHSSNFTVGYKKNDTGDDNTLSLALGNAIKFKADRVNLEEIIKFINKEILGPTNPTPTESGEDEGEVTALTNISLPILKMLNEKDYAALLNSFHGISIEGTTGNILKISVSNGLFNDVVNGEDDNFDLILTINDLDGISNIAIKNARYGEYTLDFSVSIDDAHGYNQDTIDNLDTSGYIDLMDIKGVIYQVRDIMKSQSLGIDLVEAKYGDITITGSADVQIGHEEEVDGVKITIPDEYAIQIYITDKTDTLNTKYHDIRLIYEEDVCYITYAQDNKSVSHTDTTRVYIGKNPQGVGAIKDVVDTLRGMISREDSYLNEYLAQYIGGLTTWLGGKEIAPEVDPDTGLPVEQEEGFDILSLLYKDYFVNNGITYTPATDSTKAKLEVVVNGSSLDLPSNPTLTITFSDDGYIENISGDMIFSSEDESTHVITNTPASIDVDIRDYNGANKNIIIPNAVRKTGALWSDITDVGNAVHFFADLTNDQQRAIVNQINDLLGNNETKTNKAVLDFNFDIRRDPKVAPISEFKNGKIYVDFTPKYYCEHDKKFYEKSQIVVNNKCPDCGAALKDQTTLQMLQNLKFKASANVYKEGIIDSNFDMRVVDQTAYFKYAHDSEHEDFRVKYTLTKVDDLLNIIKKYSSENPTFKELIEGIFPTSTSSSSSDSGTPISNILSSGDFTKIFKYYVSTNYDKSKNELFLVFDGALLGMPAGKGNVQLGINAGDYGLKDIKIVNFYAFGYYLNGTVTLKPTSDYVAPDHPTDKNTYVPLEHVNDMLEDVLSLFGTDYRPVNYKLSGKYDDMLLDAMFDFYLNKDENDDGTPDKNIGSAKIAVSMGEKTHYIQADLNAQLISMNDYANQDTDPEAKKRVDEAAAASTILFSYGDTSPVKDANGKITGHGNEASTTKMYGQLNLGSIFDIVKIVTEVTGDKSGRISNIMEIFSSEGSQTIFQKIIGGDVEALLYNKLIDSFTYDSTAQTYHIVLNENLFKLHEDDYTAPISLTMAMGDTEVIKRINGVDVPTPMKFIKQLKVEGRYSGKPIELELLATETPITPLTVPNEFNGGHGAYNFNSIQDLARGLLNTVLYDDYAINGSIKLDGILKVFGIQLPKFTDATIDVKSFLHIVQEEDKLEDYYANIELSNIPFIRVGVTVLGYEAYYNVSDDRDAWDQNSDKTWNRSFTIYLENIARRIDGVPQYEQVPVVDSYGNPIYEEDGVTPLMKNGSLIRDTHIIIESRHSKNGTEKVRRLKLTMDEFTDNLTHWLVNYGLGIKARNDGSSVTGDQYASLDGDVLVRQTSNDQDFINMFNYHSASDHTPTYSTLLESYNYYDVGERVSEYDEVLKANTLCEHKTWTTTVDIQDLANNDMLQSCGVAIYGGKDSSGKEFLESLLADIVMGIDVTLASGTMEARVAVTVDPTTVSKETRDANTAIVTGYMSDYLEDPNTHNFRDYLLGGATYVA